ncbi:MAG: glycosyltransferase [Rhodospirillaceae bacterium]|nr:glycosyltransferase [Rhodospirillaceae bacterium]
MKIFHLLAEAAAGGVERQLVRLSGVLQRAGIEQRAMFTHNPALANKLSHHNVETVEMEFPSRFAFLDRRRINAVIRRFAPDMVISWTPDVAVMVQKDNLVHLGRLGTVFDHEALLNKCHHLFTPAQSRGDAAMVAGWSVQQVHVLPHLPMTDEELAAAKPLNRKQVYTPPTAKLIFTSMRLTKKAGLETLLDAVARLSGYYLWIAGDGADREALEAAAHERGVKPRVRFLGWQDNLAPYLAACDVFVYPARQEDVGDAIAEAWAAGAPVIAADSLGPGLLIKHKENGLLVPVDDAISMAEAIKWLSADTDLAKRLTAAGAKAFAENLAMDKVAPQYLDLVKKLTGRTI